MQVVVIRTLNVYTCLANFKKLSRDFNKQIMPAVFILGLINALPSI